MALATLSWLDVVLIVVLVGSIGLGFHQGFIRQFVLLISMYLATVLAAMYHGALGSALMATFPGSTVETAGLVAFLALFVLFSILVTWLIWTAYRETRLPSVVMADEIGGSVVGAVIGLFVINVCIVAARYALTMPWPDQSAMYSYLYQGLSYSALQKVFSAPLPFIQVAIQPWLPDGLPVLLRS